MSVSFILGEKSPKRIYSIRMFEGLNPIGEVSSMIGSQVFRGEIHGGEFELIPQTPISGMISVSYRIYKASENVGSLNWSKSDFGILNLIKKTRGTNLFEFRRSNDVRFVIFEKDGVQEVGRIDTKSVDCSIWSAEVSSPQRLPEQAHEILLYCAFLLHHGLL